MKGIDLEAAGKAVGRGLDPTDNEGLQTFEVFIPLDVRINYNRVFFSLKNKILKDAQEMAKGSKPKKKKNIDKKKEPPNMFKKEEEEDLEAKPTLEEIEVIFF